jgi:hypothetical protein
MAKPQLLNVSALKADPENRRTHTTRNKAMLVDSLNDVRAARSIVIDEDNVILAGNGVVEKAEDAGITKVQVIEADGETLIAVRRSNLTPEQKRRLAMYDNRTAELAEWNPEQLSTDKARGLDLVPFFTDRELDVLLEVEGLTELRKRANIDRPAEVAWVLVALPLTSWPKHQAAVEAMQKDASFTGVAIRQNKEAK